MHHEARARRGWIPILVVAAAFVVPSGLLGQELRGVVRDGSTGEPVDDVLVRVDSIGDLTLTRADGSFVFRALPEGRQVLRFEKLGYGPVIVPITLPFDDVIEIAIFTRPIPIEGINVVATSFETRFEAVKTDMDLRLADLPGSTRVANAEQIRPFYENHASDPYRFYNDVLQMSWDANPEAVRIWGPLRVDARGSVRPQVYINDHRYWLETLVYSALGQYCRIELYVPSVVIPPLGLPPLQLRAYTCDFMRRVADGHQELRENINFDGLVAGPEAFEEITIPAGRGRGRGRGGGRGGRSGGGDH